MLYAIISSDVPDSLPKRQQAQAEHRARISTLKDAGRLELAGPYPAIDSENPGDAGFQGSLIVAEFDNYAAAQAWAEADPYVEAGVYQETIIKPFKKVLP